MESIRKRSAGVKTDVKDGLFDMTDDLLREEILEIANELHYWLHVVMSEEGFW